MGYLIWDEVPDWTTLVGMGLIVVSGLYIGYRELINARRAKTPAPTGEASFVPGNPAPPSIQLRDQAAEPEMSDSLHRPALGYPALDRYLLFHNPY